MVIDEDSEIDIRAGQEAPVGVPRDASADEPDEGIGATLRDDDDGKRRWRLFRKGD